MGYTNPAESHGAALMGPNGSRRIHNKSNKVSLSLSLFIHRTFSLHISLYKISIQCTYTHKCLHAPYYLLFDLPKAKNGVMCIQLLIALLLKEIHQSMLRESVCKVHADTQIRSLSCIYIYIPPVPLWSSPVWICAELCQAS